MPRLTRLTRLAAVPAAWGLLSSLARSATTRQVAGQAFRDPRGLARRLADPAVVRALARGAVRDPNVRQLTRLGLLFLPLRYYAIAQALWGARRVALRRPPASHARGSVDVRRLPVKDVTPGGPGSTGASHDRWPR